MEQVYIFPTALSPTYFGNSDLQIKPTWGFLIRPYVELTLNQYSGKVDKGCWNKKKVWPSVISKKIIINPCVNNG